MTYQLAEPLVDALVDYLDAQMPDALQAVSDEIGDGSVLHPPETIHLSETLFDTSTARGCEMAVVVDSVTVPMAAWVQGESIQPIFTLRVLIYVVESDMDVRRRKMYRYQRAVLTVLDDAMADAGSFLADYGVGIGAPAASTSTFEEAFGAVAGKVTLSYTAHKSETRS